MSNPAATLEPTLVGFNIENYYINETAPLNWERARLAVSCLHAILFTYCLFLFVVLCYSYWAMRSKKKSQARKMVSLLLGLTGYVLLECVVTFVTQVVRLDTCTGVSSLLGSTYMFSAFYGFQILYIRAKLVLSEREKWMLRFSRVLYYVSYGIVGLGIGKYSMEVLNCQPGHVQIVLVVYPWLGTDIRFFGEYCTLVNPPWVTWLFLLASTTFSLSFLSLFLYPLLRHLREVSPVHGRIQRHTVHTAGYNANSKGQEQRRTSASEGQGTLLQHTIRKNLFYSSASLATTVIHIVVVAVVATMFSDRDSPELAYMAIIPYCFTALDLLVNTWSMTMITTIWVPPSWKRFRAVYYCSKNGAKAAHSVPTKRTTLGINRTLPTDTARESLPYK